MNKTLKNILIAVLVLVIIGAAIGGYFIYRHNDTYIGAEAALNIALDDAGTTVTMIYSDDVEFEKTRHSAGMRLSLTLIKTSMIILSTPSPARYSTAASSLRTDIEPIKTARTAIAVRAFFRLSSIAHDVLHSQAVVEDALAQAEVLRRDFKQLVIGEELEALLKAELSRRDKAQRLI